LTTNQILELAIYFAIIIALTPLLGGYMKRVFAGERTFLDPVLRPL
jgi:K+-transporting ATPase ATPase A chain